jgi:hypothetical protein
MTQREPSLALPTGGARIRNAVEADVAQVVELLFRAFKRWPAFELSVSPQEHLRWKMRSDPIAWRHHWVSEIDGRIVAVLLAIARRVRMRGRNYLVRDGVDASADPRIQGGRVYGALADHADMIAQNAEFDLGCGYVTNPRMWQQRRRKGRKPLGNPIQVLEKRYRARAIIARRRQNYGGWLPAPLAVFRIKLETIFNRFGHRPYWRRAERTWSITTLERFDDRIEGFFEEAAKPFDFIFVRGKDYMNWRYCEPAAGRFTVRAAEQDGRILGYLVSKISEGSGYVVDLLALPGRIEVVRSLVEDALHLFREAGVELVTCWMIWRHPYNRMLRRYGFVDSRRDAGFSCYPIRPDSPDVRFLADSGARIHLTQGDSDWI